MGCGGEVGVGKEAGGNRKRGKADYMQGLLGHCEDLDVPLR